MDRYELELTRASGDGEQFWTLYRHTEGDQYSYIVKESLDINEIYVWMFQDKELRGNGNTMRIS